MPAAGGPPEAACRVQSSRAGGQQSPGGPEGQAVPGPGMATPVQPPGQPGQGGAVPEGEGQTAGCHAAGLAQGRRQGGGRQFVGPQQHPVETVVGKGQPVRGRGFYLHALRGPAPGLFPQGRRGFAGAQVKAALPERRQDMSRPAADDQQFPAPARPGGQHGEQQGCPFRQGDVLMERAGGLEGHAGSLKVRVLYPANVGPAGAAGKRDAG